METRPIDPSILADLPAAVAALPIELRSNGERLILHTHVCTLLEIGPSGLRRLVERGKILRAETGHNKAWYHAHDVAALWRERHPSDSGIELVRDATGDATPAARVETHVTPSDDVLRALSETIQRFVQAQASTIQSQSATIEQLAGTNSELTRTCADLSNANIALNSEARAAIAAAADLRTQLAQEQARREQAETQSARLQAAGNGGLLARLFGRKTATQAKD